MNQPGSQTQSGVGGVGTSGHGGGRGSALPWGRNVGNGYVQIPFFQEKLESKAFTFK